MFSIADLDIVSPAYEQFRENLADLASVDQGPVRFVCTQVDTNFPQFFQYQRVKELVRCLVCGVDLRKSLLFDFFQ